MNNSSGSQQEGMHFIIIRLLSLILFFTELQSAAGSFAVEVSVQVITFSSKWNYFQTKLKLNPKQVDVPFKMAVVIK